MATAKDSYLNFYFQTNSFIFLGKSPNLIEFSFSLPELWAKNLKGGAEHPPGQDRVKISDRKAMIIIKNLTRNQNLRLRKKPNAKATNLVFKDTKC